MSADWQTDLTQSASDFLNQVWPKIKRWKWFKRGELLSVESVTNVGFTRDLDMLAGIDAWHIVRESSVMRGIASRAQRGGGEFRTFTIRTARDSGTETEYAKRLRAIKYRERGWLYPHLTIQAYLSDDGKFRRAAGIETKALFEIAQFITDNEDVYYSDEFDIDFGWRRTSNAKFLWINWAYLKRSGSPIEILEAPC